MIGVKKNSEVKKNRDGSHDVRMLVCEMADADDVQSVEIMAQGGVDFHPPADSRMLIIEVGPAFKIAIACDDGLDPSVDEGEYRIYGIAGGAIVSDVHCKNDGTVAVNLGGGTAVEFKRLKTAFDQLKADFDNHVHPAGLLLDSTAAPCTGTTAAILVGSTADIDPAESATVLIP